MNKQLRIELLNTYGSIEAFASSAAEMDFVWGIADLFGYTEPADLRSIAITNRRLLVLSLFLKSFKNDGLARAFEEMGDVWPDIVEGFRWLGVPLAYELTRGILEILVRENVDLDDEQERWSFVERMDDFRKESAQFTGALCEIVAGMRSAVLRIEREGDLSD